MDLPANIITTVFWLLAGLALFLYGIEIMGKALRKAVGMALRNGLARLTRTRFHGLITGTVATGLLQSSSATTVMVVGFISAGLITFPRSVGLIIGANIGATVTTVITAFHLGNFSVDDLALPLLGMGFLANYFSRRRTVRQLGLACMGFGMLFFGLVLMKLAVFSYRDLLRDWMTTCGQGGFVLLSLAFVISMLGTALIQSSAATVVIIQSIAAASVDVDIGVLIPMILGAHIGTCITAMLASLKASRAARRAAVTHLVFNVIGVMFTLALFPVYVLVMPRLASDPVWLVAGTHSAIKLVNAALLLPFTHQLARLARRLVPGDDALTAAPEFLDYSVMDNPRAACRAAALEIRRLASTCVEMLQDAVKAMLDRDEMLQVSVEAREELVDDLQRSIAHYLLDVSRAIPPGPVAGSPAILINVLNNVERIGDHAENIVETAQVYSGNAIAFSPDAVKHIEDLVGGIDRLGQQMLQRFDRLDETTASEADDQYELLLVRLEEILEAHRVRRAEGTCEPLTSIVYTDLVANLHSVARHVRNASRLLDSTTAWREAASPGTVRDPIPETPPKVKS